MDRQRSFFWFGLIFLAIAAFELVTDVLWLFIRVGVRPTVLSASTGAVILVAGVVFLLGRKRV